MREPEQTDGEADVQCYIKVERLILSYANALSDGAQAAGGGGAGWEMKG